MRDGTDTSHDASAPASQSGNLSSDELEAEEIRHHCEDEDATLLFLEKSPEMTVCAVCFAEVIFLSCLQQGSSSAVSASEPVHQTAAMDGFFIFMFLLLFKRQSVYQLVNSG